MFLENIDFNELEDHHVAIENQFLRALSECLKDDIFQIKDNIFWTEDDISFFMLDFFEKFENRIFDTSNQWLRLPWSKYIIKFLIDQHR